jgi:phenylacetate-CoA ligase
VQLRDVAELPFTDKDALARDSDAFLCVPEAQIVDVCTTSGSTGVPLLCKLTRADLARLAYNEYLSFSACGLSAEDRVLLAVTLDKCFMAGLAYFSGLNLLGAASARVGPTSPEMFLSLAERTRATAVVGVPSYLLRVHEYAQESGFDLARLCLTKLVLIGEPVRGRDFALNALGARLSAAWGGSLSSTYGVTELQSSACECSAGRGGHLHPELVHVEIVADDGASLPPGELGEVVVTTFGVQGMPLLRYKTGDIATLAPEPCSCGLLTPRLGPILGRKQQRLKIKGTTLYPQAITSVLDGFTELREYVVLITSAHDMSDAVEIKLAFAGSADPTGTLALLSERLKGQLKISPQLTMCAAEEIVRIKSSVSERKKTKVVDRRVG